MKIIISRTDSIGDVVLTLPMAGFIKKNFPAATVLFIGRSYTKSIIELSEHVDVFINYDDLEKLNEAQQTEQLKAYHADTIVHVFPLAKIAALAKKAGIALRVGTTNRIYHWWNCNKRIALSRKNSNLHESQLNFKLLEFLGRPVNPELSAMPGLYGFSKVPQLAPEHLALIDNTKYTVILHPKSKGSAKEWGLDNFSKLIEALNPDKYQVFISGIEQDGKQMQDFLSKHTGVTNLTGKLSLTQFIAFINACNALVAASTGPLHIAAALGKRAIGLYSPKRPIHPGRWMPVGSKAHSLVFDVNCKACANGEDCYCIQQISPQQIIELLN
ncbi:MAG: glycosyltransferase family 9 protein [Bacteroidia bacterium]|nr:glycosyltransferase family 9 protein [Bacteroidia bacterium]